MIKVKPEIKNNIHIDKQTFGKIMDFIIAFILTRSVIFLSILPFGIAFSVANIRKINKVYAMLGAFFGYLFLENSVYGFRYAGTLLIISALAHLIKANIYAIIIGVMPIFSLLEMVSSEFTYNALLLMICEVVVCVTSTFLYEKLLDGDEKNKKICILFFAVTLISSMSNFTIFFDISPIRIFAVMIILCVTYFAKNGTGCIVSVILGIAMDSSLGVNSAIFTLSYSFASVISGTLANINKALFSIAFFAMYGVSAIFGANSYVFIASLLEVMIASILFIIIPTSKFVFVEKLLKDNMISYNTTSEKVFDMTSNASNILMYMSKVLNSGIEKIGAITYKDINKIYYMTTESVCKNCELSHICWSKDYTNSIDALNAATSKAIVRGYFISTDFPFHFSTRCINFSKFLNMVNEGTMELNKNIQINKTLESNKKAISEQCTAISAILKDITYHATDPVEAFPNLEEEISQELNKYSLGLTVLAYNNSFGKFFVEIIGKNTFDVLKHLTDVISMLSKIVGKPMEMTSHVMENKNSKIIFRQKDVYKLNLSSKIIAKQRVSGDSLDIFKNDDGTHFIIISDGMGSGYIANEESLQVVGLLSKMLKSGLSITKALRGVGPLICIKNNEKNFVALDVLSIDLTTLEGILVKFGAAPTYIFREGKVHKISSTNMPLGISTKSELSRLKFMHKDIILMMSDGILSTEQDDFIVDILKNSYGKTCEQICDEILLVDREDDDKTIIAIKIDLNK